MAVPTANGRKCENAVSATTFEIDARGFLEITHGHGHIAETKTEVNGLDQELRIEDEVVGISLERHRFEHLTAIDSEARVKIAEVLAQGEVLEACQSTVGDILPRRHAASQGFAPRTNPTPSTTSQIPSSMKLTALGMTRLSYW